MVRMEAGSGPRRPVAGWYRPLGAKAAILAGALVLIVAGAITGVAVSTSSGGSAPDFAWTAVGDTSIVGQWTTSDSVVLGTGSGLSAYAAATGTKVWTWDIPQGSWLCGMSQSASDDLGAVIYGSGPNECTSLQTIDLATGKPVWPQSLPVHSGLDPGRIRGSEELSIGGNVVAASAPAAQPTGAADMLASVNAASGKVYWSTGSWNLTGCDLVYDNDAVVLAGIVYAVAGCYSGAVLTYEAILAINAATGAASPVNTLDPADCIGADGRSEVTISAFSNYLVVRCPSALYAVAPGSTALTRLDTTGVDTSPAGLDDNGGDSTLVNLVSSGSTLYLVAQSGAQQDDGVVAVDMADGRQLWTAGLSGATAVSLLSAGTAAVVAVGANDSTGAASLYSINAAGGRVTTLVGGLGGAATEAFAQLTPAACLPAGSYVACSFDAAQIGALKPGS